MRKSKVTSLRNTQKSGMNTMLFRMPIVEICGAERVLVENHQGIIGYSDIEIRIRVCFGWVSVSGQMLKLCRISREQVVICGRINGVTLQER